MLPPLYKFRPINGFTLDSLREGYLFFSNPTTFNDPFGFRIFLNHKTDDETLKEQTHLSISQHEPEMSSEERESLVEIDPNSDDLLSHSQKVQYRQEYPFIDMRSPDSGNEKIMDRFLTKSPDWSYEDEYRAMDLKPEGYRRPIAPEALVSITYGAKD